MKKVLVITYYWPPSGGAGVQRWLKFVKYLPQFGWQPIVYTPSNPENPVDDSSLEKDIPPGIEIFKTPIWEPYDLYKKFVGKGKNEKINSAFLSEKKKTVFTEKLSVWIRGNFFIPDARKFWINPSVKFLSDYLSKNNVDAIASTGPPHSMHLIALELKKKFNLPWLADFRDPWTNIDFYKDLMLTASADRKHKKLEKDVLIHANAVVSVGETMSREFQEIVHGSCYHVITNGFDAADSYKGEITLDKKFSLVHIGTLVKTRNPETLWKVLAELINSDAGFKNDLEIKLVGKVDFSVMESLTQNNLKTNLTRIEYLTHDEVIKVQQQSQVLLLLLNNTPNAKGILTGKFFEYLAAQRPILCIGPIDGDAAGIVAETNSGKVVNFDDEVELKNTILSFYSHYKKGNLFSASKNISAYSRVSLTEKLKEVLESISLKKQ